MLTDVQKFQADFNLQMVPAPVGLPVSPVAAAAMLGASEQDLARYLEESAATVRRTAAKLLLDQQLVAALNSWLQQSPSKVMFVGDSITTYLYSYARLLPAMLDLHRPKHAVRFLNVAQSGYTTTHAFECTYTQYVLEQPDWVFVMLGVNDAKQFDGQDQRPLVPPEAYRANIQAMVTAFSRHTRARILLISPTPVVETITGSWPDFLTMRLSWDNRVIRRYGDALAEIATQHRIGFIDLFELFGFSPQPEDYMPGGLHPGPLGHQRIVPAILRFLAESSLPEKT